MDFIKDNIELTIVTFIIMTIITIYIISWFRDTTYKIDCLRLKEYEWDDYEIEVMELIFSDRIAYKFKTSEDLGDKFRIKNNIFEKQSIKSLEDTEYTYISEKRF